MKADVRSAHAPRPTPPPTAAAGLDHAARTRRPPRRSPFLVSGKPLARRALASLASHLVMCSWFSWSCAIRPSGLDPRLRQRPCRKKSSGSRTPALAAVAVAAATKEGASPKSRATGKEKITVPVKKPEPAPVEPPKIDPPVEELNIPAKTMAAAETPLAGALEPPKVAETASQGTGSGGGGGTGTGTGQRFRTRLGPRRRRGRRHRRRRLSAGQRRHPSACALREEASIHRRCHARQGAGHRLAGVRRHARRYGRRRSRSCASLDSVFGLDQEAIKAARQWRFMPGMRSGEPVPVLITIELTFTLR